MRSSASHKQSRGYSLAEILVATAIFTLVLVGALLIYDRSNRVVKSGVESGDLQQNTRIGFDRLVADLRMAGYDFDRDGIPSIADVYQQPDEQLEFIHPHAIVIRGNFDAEQNNTGDKEYGRDTAYEPAGGQFPFVTTGNDEIVAYALKSDKGPNTDSIEFYADTRKPRKTYTGGVDEQKVTIPGVNLCTNGCVDPPYTLYRITLKDADLTTPNSADKFVFSPLASNIRRLEFAYFSDPAATTSVTPNDGVGQYTVSVATTSAATAARALRETVNAIRVDLIGMSANPTPGYASPIELSLPADEQNSGAWKEYREVQLQSVVVPRNLGRRGMEEYTTDPPGAATVTGALYGCCGVVKVTWTAPPAGIVDGYSIIYDTSPTGPFGSTPTSAGTNLFGYVSGLDPAQKYYFMVVASNSYGSQRSLNYYPSGGVYPINRTNSGAPTGAGGVGTPPTTTTDPAGNNIIVNFKAPTVNTTSDGGNLTLSDGATDASAILVPAEITGYEIYRSTTTGFTPPGSGVAVFTGALTDTGAPAYNATTGTLTFTDATAKVNCLTYYYKIRAWEKCKAATTQNSPATTELSYGDWSSEFSGTSVAGAAPAKPTGLSVASSSTCSTNPCTISLSWAKVTTDSAATPNPIQITSYTVRRETYNGSTLVAGSQKDVIVTDASPTVAGTMTYVDTTAPKPAFGTAYTYTVRAEQCSATSVGEFSLPKTYPCMSVSVTPPTGVLDGSGTAADPYVVTAPTGKATLVTDVAIASGVGKLYNAAGTYLGDITPAYSNSNKQADFDIPLTGNDGSTYRLDMYVTDAAGCTDLEQMYVYDSPTGCCLAPWKRPDLVIFDSTIVQQATAATALSTSFGYSSVDNSVIITFKNLCDQALTIKSFELNYNSAKADRIMGAAFPNTTTGYTGISFGASGSTSNPVTFQSSGSAAFPADMKMTIPANSTTYKVQINLKNNTAPADITRFCVTYDRTKADGTVESSQACKIAPSPSASGSCN